jgi:hypothetical protein
VGSWLDRYLRGDRVHVWTEMTGMGTDVLHSEVADDARAVARERMRRVRINIAEAGLSRDVMDR